jgi:arylsulfatase A-like enzyme
LKEQDIYDQSLIIVTAPHGEILDDSRLPYHHFLLTPDTLHVPLIVKLPLSSGTKRGARIGGTVDLIDLFPTIMDIEQLPIPSGLSGVSRWDAVRSGSDIPPHDSFATGLHQLAHSLCHPPYLMTLQRPGNSMKTFHAVLNGSEAALYHTESGELVYENSSVADDLSQQLRSWQSLLSEA